MELKDYSTEELKAELKRRYDEIKKERSKIKRCKHCEYWDKISYHGVSIPNSGTYGIAKCCKFFKTKNNKYYRTHKHYDKACEHFKEIVNE